MTFLFTFLTFLCSAITLVVVILFLRRQEKAISLVHKRIDSIFSMDKPTPNDATKEDPNMVDIDEQNMILPKGVKFEVEGGETQVPPGFQEKAP